MRGVTTQAGKLSYTLQETSALTQICRFKAHVPGAVPVEGGAARNRKAMTLPTRVIQLRRGEIAWIAEGNFALRPLVFASGAVASLAADSSFVGAYIAAGDLHGPGGVAVEAFGDI